MFSESLEQRRLLSVTAVESHGGHLSVSETRGSDIIDVAENPSIKGNVIVTDEVADVAYTFVGVKSCEIDGLGGNDSISTETDSFGCDVYLLKGGSGATITDTGCASSAVFTDNINCGNGNNTIYSFGATTAGGFCRGSMEDVQVGNGVNSINLNGTSATINAPGKANDGTISDGQTKTV